MIGGRSQEAGSPSLRRELDGGSLSSQGSTRVSHSSDRPLSPLSIHSQNYTGYHFRQIDDSEDDWTGASDCTGASSDSGFICPQLKKLSVGSSSRQFPSQLEHTISPRHIASPSHTMRGTLAGESDYMNIIQTSLDKDNTYVTISRAHSTLPGEDGSSEGSPTPTGGEQSRWSLTEDGYCRMVPSRDGAVRVGNGQGLLTTAHSRTGSSMTSYSNGSVM